MLGSFLRLIGLSGGSPRRRGRRRRMRQWASSRWSRARNWYGRRRSRYRARYNSYRQRFRKFRRW